MKQDIKQIGKPVSVTLKEDVTLNDKGMLPHIKGAMVYNKVLIDNKMDKRYKIIKNKQKVIMLYLQSESKKADNINKFRSNAISIPLDDDYPTKIFDIVKVDREKLFETTFLNPVKEMFLKNGWKLFKSKRRF